MNAHPSTYFMQLFFLCVETFKNEAPAPFHHHFNLQINIPLSTDKFSLKYFLLSAVWPRTVVTDLWPVLLKHCSADRNAEVTLIYESWLVKEELKGFDISLPQ